MEIPTSLDLSGLGELVLRAGRDGRPLQVEIPVDMIDGVAGIHLVDVIPVPNILGAIDHIIAYGRSIANMEKLKAEMAQAQDQLHAAIKVLPDIFWIKDVEGRYVLCNDQFDAFNGIEKGSMLGRRALELDHSKKFQIHHQTDLQALSSTEPVRFSLEVPARDGGGNRHYDVQKVAIRDGEGKLTGLLGMSRDVTARELLERELAAREREYRQLAEHLPDCLIRYAATGLPVYMNTALQGVLTDKLGLALQDLFDGAESVFHRYKTLVDLKNSVLQVLERGLPHQAEYTFDCLDGGRIIHEIRLFPEFGDDGAPVSVLGIGRDVTKRKLAELELAEKEAELQRLAFTDSLTGLANRATFNCRLREDIDSSICSGTKVALLTLDVDRFKSINDSLGHATGDELLKQFANRIAQTVGPDAWLGRLGGDEFAVILSNVTTQDAVTDVAQRIINEVSLPMVLDGTVVSVSTSIGITICPDDSHCEATLFRYSDLALYRAKALGRARYCRYTSDMNRAAKDRFEMEAMIGGGLRLGQFTTYFQPKTDLETGQICGAEALCRWRHPQSGYISPAEFIPVAEETGQIIEIGQLVLWQAARFAVTCNAGLDRTFRVAVNVSARQLLFGGFLGTLGHCLEATGCEPAWLELEITESLLLSDNAAITETLQTIADLGILISIDDFGTGYSALSYLHRFPIGGLKIDQSFVREINHDPKREVLVKAILAMAKGLGLKTVAEGVETEETAQRLMRLGCDQGQGYFWHRPMPAESLLDLLRQRAMSLAV